jgi:hypothetical protein
MSEHVLRTQDEKANSTQRNYFTIVFNGIYKIKDEYGETYKEDDSLEIQIESSDLEKVKEHAQNELEELDEEHFDLYINDIEIFDKNNRLVAKTVWEVLSQ